MKSQAKSKNLKKSFVLIKFAIAIIADMLMPGSGIALEVGFLIWKLLEIDRTEGED